MKFKDRLVQAVALPFRPKIAGKEHVPSEGGLIMAANHQSYLDPIFVWLSCDRDVHFLAKAELFKIPLLSFTIRRYKAIPIHRKGLDKVALKTALDYLKEGKVVGIYPEGTRKKEGIKPEDAFSGISMLASRSGAPVVPVRIFGSERAWRGGLIPIRVPKVKVAIGKPISFEAGSESREEFAQRVMKSIQELECP